MASTSTVTLGRLFVTGRAPLMHHASSECLYRHHQSYGFMQNRVPITCESSTVSKSSSQKQQQQMITEHKSSVAVEAPDLHKILQSSSPKTNWWTPMFHFSFECKWSTNFLRDPDHESISGQSNVPVSKATMATPATGVSAIPQSGTNSSSSSISLVDLIASSSSSSSKQIPAATVTGTISVTPIHRQQQDRKSTSLPDVIALSSSQQQTPNSARRMKKQVIFDDNKARELRKQTRRQQTWHDAWVQSAIASRLAMPED
ncbi:hypothetical protein R1flu_011351 [Riccia fluitans]|uniref:Uncharacterized protein n=1 Tax=Riccia fluitans TaxID=41844 RepID=A0ABD1Z8P8_9MARC